MRIYPLENMTELILTVVHPKVVTKNGKVSLKYCVKWM